VGISNLGAVAVFAALVVLLVWFARQGRWGTALALLLATGGAQALNSLLKALFHRPRPEATSWYLLGQAYSFPSGHAMVSAAFFGFLVYFGWRTLRGWARVVWCGGMVLLIVLIGLSRLYLGVHYLTDVVAGYLAGFFWLDAVLIGAHLLSGRRGPTAQPEPRRLQREPSRR
jgi:undecaprenyl-diphosphatase